MYLRGLLLTKGRVGGDGKGRGGEGKVRGGGRGEEVEEGI